jgi:SatD family (SatD)
MKEQHILMADVIDSRKYKGKTVALGLAKIVEKINSDYKTEIVSPLTVTLGDEFQGVISNEETVAKIIISIEEFMIENRFAFKLRYASHTGKIDTKINKNIAYGMLGEGLTRTREILNNAKKGHERFFIFTEKKTSLLNKLFIVFESFVDSWKQKDFSLISLFLKGIDYKKVAIANNYTASAMWKKRKSLQIHEYNTIKEIIFQHASHN